MKKLKETEFKAFVEQKGTVVIDVWGQHCSPCQALSKMLPAQAKKHPAVKWGKVQWEKAEEALKGLRIRCVPTLLVYKDGKLTGRHAGIPQDLDAWLAKEIGT